MAKTNKIANLKRLNLKNKFIVLGYLLKELFKIKQSQEAINAYLYYNYLINNNGFLIEETNQYYISNFVNKYPKNIKLRKKPSSDFEVFSQVYGWKEYFPVVNEYKINFSNSNDGILNIIDAGSNIGLTALFFTDHFEKVKIISVEPDPDNFKILNYNLPESYSFEFVKINGAIWSSNTKIKVVKDFRDKSDWSYRVEETHEENAIQAYSINHLIESNDFEFIDILKIDIEGSEKQIFTSLDANLDFLDKTKCIAIEIHDEFDCREAIYNVLEKYSFTFINKGELTIGVNQKLKHKLNNINDSKK